MSEIFAEIQFMVETKTREIMRHPDVRERLRRLGTLNKLLRGFTIQAADAEYDAEVGKIMRGEV